MELQDLTEKVPFEMGPEIGQRAAMWMCAESRQEDASPEALEQQWTWSVWRTSRRPRWQEQSEQRWKE